MILTRIQTMNRRQSVMQILTNIFFTGCLFDALIFSGVLFVLFLKSRQKYQIKKAHPTVN